ncbi:MAG: hypothetical protein QM537_01585 [Candidatus Symbiobacter sp.]|nr:hypothetical protein [Candidatus Symbiobacter sp.]
MFTNHDKKLQVKSNLKSVKKGNVKKKSVITHQAYYCHNTPGGLPDRQAAAGNDALFFAYNTPGGLPDRQAAAGNDALEVARQSLFRFGFCAILPAVILGWHHLWDKGVRQYGV